MERERFQNYCDCIKQMKLANPSWTKYLSRGLLADYLRENTAYGFARVLNRLLVPAYAIVMEEANREGADWNILDMARSLYARETMEEYYFPAYLFVIGVASVCFGKLQIEQIEYERFDENDLFRYDGELSMVTGDDEETKRLKKYGLRLLDFSRNNPLVHFRPVKSGTLALHSADIYATMHHVAAKRGKIYLVGWKKLKPSAYFKCKICGRIEQRKYDFSVKTQPAMPCPVCDATNTHNRKSLVAMKEQLYRLPDGGYVCKCGRHSTQEEIATGAPCAACGAPLAPPSFPLVTKRELSNYAAGELVCGIGDTSAKETLKGLTNKSKTMERNFGLHVLYLACGFLRWRDRAGTEYNSPILLIPINLSVDKGEGRYYFEADASAANFEANHTLAQMLAGYSATCSIALPSVDEFNVNVYFTLLKKALVANEEVAEITKNWEISAEMGVGLFHYQKLQLHRDIEENQEQYLAHPIIRRLCGDMAAEIQPTATQERQSLEFTMLDADSSQEEVIKAAQEGKSFILQGSPGSGKSQTITNVITSALGAEKTVLFVTEKASARSVIFENLTRCGGNYKLTDFVLDFDGFKKRSGAIGREPFVEEINRCLTSYSPTGGYEDCWLAHEEIRHEQVQTFIQQSRGVYDEKNYMRLLQSLAPYAEVQELHSQAVIPTEWLPFANLCDEIAKYYYKVEGCHAALDYKQDALYGCLGDETGELVSLAERYRKECEKIFKIVILANNHGWTIAQEELSVLEGLAQMQIWAQMPQLPTAVLDGFNEKKCEALLVRIAKRKIQLDDWQSHAGRKHENLINAKNACAVDASTMRYALENYRSIFKRLGKGYQAFRMQLFTCFKETVLKASYKDCVHLTEILSAYKEYVDYKQLWEVGIEEDIALFGYSPETMEEWEDLRKSITLAKRLYAQRKESLLGGESLKKWLLRFGEGSHAATIATLNSWLTCLAEACTEEFVLREKLKVYFDEEVEEKESYPIYNRWSQVVMSEKSRLKGWKSLTETVETLKAYGYLTVLDELIASRLDYDGAKKRLDKTFYKKTVEEFVARHKLTTLRDFDRFSHERLLKSYAEADKKVLESGAKRLYEKLKGYLKVAASKRSGAGEYPKLQSKTHYSVKRTISENWEYIKAIKPCFMMSPLNVSQYVSADISFDLVIFDEASQVFTEDALAAIMRGKQVIIAGDSKQLPPCDFFRAGDGNQDEEEVYVEEEAKKDYSLLVSATEALNDATVSLAWHYRSCDESLIAFANEQMEYNLITFPSAKHNENDGIRYVRVPYSPDTCYEAGKGGAHINAGEADKIVELIYSEMTNPERSGFSIGVVAFSNAQATEIENRWEEFKADPSRKKTIEAWEKAHEYEPLIFCNLDTVQGDERDTTILSICYSQDQAGKFNLLYLGRIRLLSGKKRINVAVTRARHQMIIVSTLDSYTLKTAIHNSTALAENKAGAEMLCSLLEYAQSFEEEREVVCRASENPFVQEICKIFDEREIPYATDIGRSICKINIGIKDEKQEGSFILGIIIDDPARADFDSVREYTRLTEQVLQAKYGWNLYRIYPTAWVYDYEGEKSRLLAKIRSCV